MTRYEKAIFDIVRLSHAHLTVNQIFEILRERYPNVVLATVYNNVNKLWETGLIRKVSVEGMPDRYDTVQKHDHLVCKYCGKLADVDLGDLTRQLEKTAGIPILSYDLKLLYVCEECKNKRKGM